MTPLHVETPLLRSDPWSARVGAPVDLKMDCFQPAGSFKIRGMGRACSQAVELGARRVVTSSGGNAGLAVAHACRALDTPATVIVPRTTRETVREAIRRLGAEVLEHGASWDDAHERAVELASEVRAAYVHPFDDPAVWAGHASVVEEIARQGSRPGSLVVSVGGGGLLCGILEGLHRAGWQDVPVLAVETEGAASFSAALEAGKTVRLDAIRSIATTLGAREVTGRLLEWDRCHEIRAVTVTDREAVEACLRFADDHRVLVEPACGAALAAAERHGPWLSSRGTVVIEVCGGSGVSLAQLRDWASSLGIS